MESQQDIVDLTINDDDDDDCFFLTELSEMANLLNQHCLKNIYHSHLHMHISYGLSVWGSMITQQKINKLFNIQKQCVQIITGQQKLLTYHTCLVNFGF